MKKILFFFTITFSLNLIAQNVYIPDANFKNRLLNLAFINTNSDTDIQVSEAVAFAGTLTFNFANISNITGIEAFTSITGLNLRDNNLTGVNLSSNTSLITVNFTNNLLTSLLLPTSTSLTTLECANNRLTSLDITSCTALNYLDCGANQFTSLSITNPSLTYLDLLFNSLLTSLDVSGIPTLFEVFRLCG